MLESQSYNKDAKIMSYDQEKREVQTEVISHKQFFVRPKLKKQEKIIQIRSRLVSNQIKWNYNFVKTQERKKKASTIITQRFKVKASTVVNLLVNPEKTRSPKMSQQKRLVILVKINKAKRFTH